MTSRFTQLGHNLEQIIAGVEMRRHTRRNWMERLMFDQDDSGNSNALSQESDPVGNRCVKPKQAEQSIVKVHGTHKSH